MKLSHGAHQTQTPVRFMAPFRDTQERGQDSYIRCPVGTGISVYKYCLLCSDFFLSFLRTDEHIKLIEASHKKL